ncbi:hypothetical protein [Streptomyces sp. NPDC058861]|uniref:hypothetical protein n=1 Tax=Streptomyces sp. NPDC058861 TaxID=3346653 RepID=UPI0036A58BF3
MSAINLDKNEPTTPPATTAAATASSDDTFPAAFLFAILPLLMVTFCLIVVLFSLDGRDSRTGHRTTPAPAVTQCSTPAISGTVPGTSRP